MPETIAVTGGNGRIGQPLLDHLDGQGYRTVNLSRGKREESTSDQYLRTDLLDAGEVYGSLAKSDADAVVHLGMIGRPDGGPGFRTYESNVVSSYHVLEAAGELGIETVTIASSFSAYGAGFKSDPIAVDYLPFDEAHRVAPTTSYGIGKQSLEIAADGFARRPADSPQTIASLRFPWVVDDDLAREAFVEPDRTLDGLREANEFHGERNTLFTYVHMTDATDLVARTVAADFDGHERFAVSAPDTNVVTPTRDLVGEVFPDAELRESFEAGAYTALVDTSKAERLLGWEPTWCWRSLV